MSSRDVFLAVSGRPSLLDGFSVMGTKVNEVALKLLISSVDFDGSGLIELDEFEVIMVGPHGYWGSPSCNVCWTLVSRVKCHPMTWRAIFAGPYIMGSKKQFQKLKAATGDDEEVEELSTDEEDDGGFNSTWARGLRRKKLIAAAIAGGDQRIRMVRMANEAEEEAKNIMMEEELAKETDALKAGEVFGQQLNFKASAAIAAAAAAAAAAGAAAGLPTIPLKFLRDKGSGAAAVAALNAMREAGRDGYRESAS